MDKMAVLMDKLLINWVKLDFPAGESKTCPHCMKTSAASLFHYFPISKRDKNWGLYVTTAGEARIAAHTVYPPTGHPKGFDFDWQHGRVLEGFAVVYISSGGGKFECKPNISTSVEAGHAFLLFQVFGIAIPLIQIPAGMSIGLGLTAIRPTAG